jgi:hypothetical protein
MDEFLKLLIHSMCTLDGVKNSAKMILNKLQIQGEKEFQKRENKPYCSDA